MDFDVFVSPRAGVPEGVTVYVHGTAVLPATPLSQHAASPGAVAVDRPFRIAVLVADGDGEAAVVGADHVNHIPGVAVDVESRPLAGIRGAVGLTCFRSGGGGDQEKHPG